MGTSTALPNFKDTSKCEFIVCSDLFMTASAKFADLLLPGVSMFEEENITKPWKFTEFLGFNNKVIEPLYECKTEYEWIRELAKRIDLEEEFTEGRDYSQWMRYIYDDLRTREPELPEYDEFRERVFINLKKVIILFPLKRGKRPGASSIPDSKWEDRAVFY